VDPKLGLDRSGNGKLMYVFMKCGEFLEQLMCLFMKCGEFLEQLINVCFHAVCVVS
jgi:hypothetical protein